SYFFSLLSLPPRSPLFPYTTLFRSPHWYWFDFANVLLGINQALCWSMTLIMKVDLVGPERRGLALGLNEFARYLAVGFTAFITRSEEHTSELQSRGHLVCRLLLEKK